MSVQHSDSSSDDLNIVDEISSHTDMDISKVIKNNNKNKNDNKTKNISKSNIPKHINTPHISLDIPSLPNNYICTDNVALEHYFAATSANSYTDYTLNIATFNINSLNNPLKKVDLLNLLSRDNPRSTDRLNLNVDILSLIDTRLPMINASYELNQLSNYSAYWNPLSASASSGGVGLIIRKTISKYVQKVTHWKDRILHADLYMAGRRCIKIISVYIPPVSKHNRALRDETINEILRILKNSIHMECIIMGDFNDKIDLFHHNYAQGMTTLKRFPLFTYLINEGYTDIHPVIENQVIPTYRRNNHILGSYDNHARTDLIWMPDSLHSEVYSSSVHDLSDLCQSDHHLLIVKLWRSVILPAISKSRTKQKKEFQESFQEKDISAETWNKFSLLTDQYLTVQTAKFPQANNPLPQNELNRLWDILSTSIIKAAKDDCIPVRKTPRNKKQMIPHDLQVLYSDLSFINRILASFSKRRLDTTSTPGYIKWKKYLNQLVPLRNRFKTDQNIQTLLTFSDTSHLSPLSVKRQLTSFKAILTAKCKLRSREWQLEQIQLHAETRCIHLKEHTGHFIDSSLNRSKRKIDLDRVLIEKAGEPPRLLTEPAEIKQATIDHFRTFVPIPTQEFLGIQHLPDRWYQQYKPLDLIHSSIYDQLLNSPTIEEWEAVIRNTPNNKAAGPSKISFGMLRHLGPESAKLLLKLVTLCLSSSLIPHGWRKAVIYPIPKPQAWESKLKNTRPITLLETARKCLTKLINNRLANIIATHQVLQGRNFAGLPGSSTDSPILALDSIIWDAHTSRKDLWILSQDISKAFDSISLPVLKAALNRIKVPALCTDLIINLFTDRFNRVITHHGLTDEYQVRIGIDQGETISPLLWTIYLDPLLTELNQSASDPYIPEHNFISQVNPTQWSDAEVLPISQLVFMDDTTLISSSKEGLENLLTISEEFNSLVNISANHSKYELVSTQTLKNEVVALSTQQTSIPSKTITLKALGRSTSFRFLGVWFNLNLSQKFVVDQLRTECRFFATTIKHKLLTDKQILYLYNHVLIPKLEFRAQTTSVPL